MTSIARNEPAGTAREPSAAQGLRILFLAPQPFYQDRGTPIRVRCFLEALAADGHRVDLLTYHEGADVAIPNSTMHRTSRLPGLNGIRPGFSLKKLFCDVVMFPKSLLLTARLRPQLIHAVEESVFMAVVARRLFGVPYVYDMHSSVMEQLLDRFPRLGVAGPILRRIERAIIRGSIGTIAVSRAIEDLVREAAPEHHVERVEDASQLPAAGAGPVWRLPAAIRMSGPVVMYVGNLEAYQGIGLLLEGFRRAVRQVPDAQLVSIGGAEALIVHYRRLAADYGIQERTHFFAPRPVEELGGILAQADVLVSPRTVGTNTPMKIFSYLDSGVPVVATRLPTHTQVLDDEIAVLVAPEPEDMSRGLVALLRDPARRAALAAAGRTRAREVHTLEAFRGKTQAFYRAVATGLQPVAAPNRIGDAGVGGRIVPADELLWEEFCQQVKHQTRYLLASEGVRQPARLLQTLGDLVNEFGLVREIPAGQDFTRVRVQKSPIPPDDFPELTPPPEHQAKFASRVSPAGVSVLYVAATFDTAVAETFDPGRGPAVASGVILRSTRPLRVLNLVNLPTGPGGSAAPEAKENQARLHLLREFANDVSKPVVKDGRDHVDYCPTQVVSEFFRYRFRSAGGGGVDGIRYPSTIDAGGENYVFFFGNDHFFPKHGSAKAPFACRVHAEPHRPLPAGQ